MGTLRAQNIRIAPHDAYFEAGERVCFDFTKAVAADLLSETLTLHTPTGQTIVFYFDLDAQDPVAPAGDVVAEVEVTTGMSVDQMLDAVVAADPGLGATGYTLVKSGNVLVFERVNDVLEVASAPASSYEGIDATIAVKGGGVYLGLIDGDITFTPSSEANDITAHQTGTTILTKILQNVGAEVEITIKEFTKEIYEELFKVAGGVHTPTGGEQVYGYGTAKVAQNLLTFAKRLRLHPVAKTAGDRSEDWMYWLTIPELGALTFSGENPQTLAMTFTAFPDDGRPQDINVFMNGDWDAVIKDV